MRALLLNSTYEPISFISERAAIKLVVKNRVECISNWDEGFKHIKGYDFVCGANLEFYPHGPLSSFKDKSYQFCSLDCLDLFKNNQFLYLCPSILRLKKYAPRHIKKRIYARGGIFKRDQYSCQYCGDKGKESELTIDHVIPKVMGGPKTWANIVTCCNSCNQKKAGRTPKQARMKLLRKPGAPVMTMQNEYLAIDNKHNDWKDYIIYI